MTTRARRGRPPHDDILTPAEWRTVHAAQHGLSTGEIARRRGVSRDAVKFHLANARAKIGLADKRALAGWFAVPRASALARQEDAMTEELQLGPIGQVSRSVSDLARAVAWYRDVLGLPHLYSFGRLAFFDCGGTRLFLEESEASVTPESVLYFRVADIARAYETLQARGVAFTSPPHMIHRHDDGTEEWMAFFDDPDGRPLAIMSQPITPQAAP